jgi:peptidoglycan/LPS O-acetylase OafA/YrhL
LGNLFEISFRDRCFENSSFVPCFIFHAGSEVFNESYIGVDVFFVISEYLITSILIKEIEADTFSIADFYERRARRILPALLFVILFCIPLLGIECCYMN